MVTSFYPIILRKKYSTSRQASGIFFFSQNYRIKTRNHHLIWFNGIISSDYDPICKNKYKSCQFHAFRHLHFVLKQVFTGAPITTQTFANPYTKAVIVNETRDSLLFLLSDISMIVFNFINTSAFILDE